MKSRDPDLPTEGVSDIRRILIEISAPELFQQQPFRVLQISTTATARELSRRTQFVEQAARNQLIPPTGPARWLPGDIPDEHQVRQAGHQLSDSRRRLIWEFLWFWPQDAEAPQADPALISLTTGNDEAAINAWLAAAGYAPDTEASAAIWHNLGVFFLFKALDQSLADCQLTTEEATNRWQRCWAWWQPLFHPSCPVWDRVRARICTLDDPALKSGAAENLRRTLPVALLILQTRAALALWDAGKPTLCAAIMKHAQGIAFTDDAEDSLAEAIGHILTPIRESLRLSCEAAEKDTKANKKEAGPIITTFLDKSEALLARLDALIPAGNPVRSNAHDTAALATLSCQIAYGKESNAWEKCVPMLQRALAMAEGASAKQRIKENLDIVINNAKSDELACTCWFCGEEPAVAASVSSVSMYGDIKIDYIFGRKSWRHGKFDVPRCSHCAAVHEHESSGIGFGLLTLLVTGSAACFVGANVDKNLGLIALCVAALFSIVVGVVMHNRGPKAKGKKRQMKDFPVVKELLSKGWSFGEKPPD